MILCVQDWKGGIFMTKDVKIEIYRIVMEAYNKVSLHNTLFFESWENSISGGVVNRVRKLLRMEPVLCRVVVAFSKEALLNEKSKSINVISLDRCKSGDVGVYLAQMLSYDSERNNARMRLLSNDATIAGTIIQGSPLCSEKFFAKFWQKHLKKFGEMNAVLMK